MGFSLKPLRCGDPALPLLKAIYTVGHFPAESTHAHYSINGHDGEGSALWCIHCTYCMLVLLPICVHVHMYIASLFVYT